MTAIVIFLIGLAKGGLGGTLGVLATPLMSLVMPADQVIGLLLPILMTADVFAVASHWQRWDRRLILLLIPGSIIGMLLGSFFIVVISPETLRRGIGVIVLIFVLYRLFERQILAFMQYKSRNWHGFVAGAVAERFGGKT